MTERSLSSWSAGNSTCAIEMKHYMLILMERRTDAAHDNYVNNK